MFKIYSCIQNDHDYRLVILAFLTCFAASIAAVTLLRHAQKSSGRDRSHWLVIAGLASGFGIWATHFIAMLGYDPGVVASYAWMPTMASLVVASVTTTVGFWIALQSPAPVCRWSAGVIVGLGIAAMHYLGMQAVTFPGELHWSPGYVAASLMLAIVPVIPALSLALDRSHAMSVVGAAALIVLAILLLHFTGMAGITIGLAGEHNPSAAILSPVSLALSVAVVAFAVVILGVLAASFSTQARDTVLASEREFQILVQGISDCAIYMLNGEGRIASWNAGAQRLKGYTAQEAIGLELSAFYSEDDRKIGLPAHGIATARQHGKFHSEGWRYRKAGTRFWAHVTIETVRDAQGSFHGFAKITRDMTRFKDEEDKLRAMSANLDAALSHMYQGLCLFDQDERLVVSNDRVGEIFGVTHAECPVGTSFEQVIRIGMARRHDGVISDEMIGSVMAQHRALIQRPLGGTVVVPLREGCILTISHRPISSGGWVTTFEDITERRRAEKRIEHMALHDGLTGLPNRLKYTEHLETEIRHAAEADSKVAVIGVDLNRFKEVNDIHGHAIGDVVLKVLSERMSNTLTSGEFVARFGGDEFAAVKRFTDDADLGEFIVRLEDCLSSPVQLQGLTIMPGASVGVAIYPADGQSPDELVNNADFAMYRAKETIGRQVCFYEHGMDEAARARRFLANDLREAVARDELSLAFQVQRSVATEKVTGYEALLRWQHPREGWISPAEFIPIAEESGDIIAIGEWVLRTACDAAMRWPQPWRVAVNLSPVQLINGDFADTVISALATSGLPASRLELEITESAFIKDKNRALHVLRRIKALGVAIAMDDFGTGYSSLDTLNSFPFDKIKIDRSFLMNSDDNHQARAIIRAVLALGRALRVPVLAEGLETEAQLRLLKDEGCDEAQGYLWGRPAPTPLLDEARPVSLAHVA